MSALPTLEDMRRDVARLLELEPSAIGDEDNLIDLGLDSMRLMQLATAWRGAGASVDFGMLAERPELAYWHALLASPVDPNV